MQKRDSYSKSEKSVIYTVIISSILPLLDGSIVNVILPNLAHYFSTGEKNIQWVVTSYFLATVPGLLMAAFLQGRIGVKKTWFLANCIFMLGSLGVGLSNNFQSIISARIVQGFGTGLLLPLSQTIIALQFGQDRVRQAMGTIAVPTVFAPAFGPLVGASIAQYMSWRLLFFINIPLILLALAIGAKHLKTNETAKTKFNLLAFVTFSLSLISFFYLTEARNINNNTTIYTIALIAVISLIFFIVSNQKAKNKLIVFSGFTNVRYTVLMIMGLIASFLFYSFLVYFPLARTTEEPHEKSLLIIGALLALQGVGAWIGRKFIYQKWKEKSPFFMIGIGLLISSFGLLCFGYQTSMDGLGFLLRGIGLGITTIVCLSAPIQYVNPLYVKDTAVITRILQQIGGALGGVFAGYLLHTLTKGVLSLNQTYLIFFLFSIAVFLLFCLTLFLSRKEKNADL
ncbi:drug:H+ antiporter-2 (14 Spanner) (DHA2) family drug resistance MFS transporter [Bartonella elizabethae Re6043vi]|uniref:Drug:H+ antiporter-2 (14 Spanner) (DHA2) family drug resistance MFS transporter n=2 Tax=Bartonella elizabethae TaxID=807 RepID=J1KBU3_BAREL|nr:MFS transporter [Bartonella elizabethae]EJF84894.1 drug:H+ antiporter-2 (14 Spanner) (DHA2) family drug resistance MFS transporter [Bartonella elizabethae Re6043vi]EJF95297.1 drug:H+ antiporter-2 (14 Spanner) (DHA2) family drug resistance MFS transporter [Bartonella elizabethae F9251 = ATCC 49927]VEJ41690.1 High-copy suppressor of rspA [Bartonella elizabethae]